MQGGCEERVIIVKQCHWEGIITQVTFRSQESALEMGA